MFPLSQILFLLLLVMLVNQAIKAIKPIEPKNMLRNNFLFRYCRRSVANHGCRLLFFGIFFLLTTLGYIGYLYIKGEGLPSSLLLYGEFVGGVCALGVLSKNYWPLSLANYFPFFWHVAVGYGLSFLAVIRFLSCVHLDLNNSDVSFYINLGVCNLVFSTLVLANLVDRKTFFILLVSGFLSGLATFYWVVDSNPLDQLKEKNLGYVAIYYLLSIGIGPFLGEKKRGNRHYINNLLAALGRELLHYTTNIIGTGQSRASLLKWCIKLI